MDDDKFEIPKKLQPEKQFEVRQLKLNKGNPRPSVKHGFFRKALSSEEAELAEELMEQMRATYSVDDMADDLMLTNGIMAFVKSMRREPDDLDEKSESRKEKITNLSAFWAKQFKECMESLGLNRKARQGLGSGDDAILATFEKLAGRGK